MDEFKPEDELKPDTSDRRPARQQKRGRGFSVPKVVLSRQHLMIGVGVLVLLLLIIGIGSALRAPSHPPSSSFPAQTGAEKGIDLSSSTAMTQGAETSTPVDGSAPGQPPQTLSAPPISGTPTEAPPQPPVSGQQQRIELPGDITDALAQQQSRVSEFSQDATGGQPTAPAKTPTKPAVEPPASGSTRNATHGGNSAHVPNKPSAPNVQKAGPTAAAKPAATASAAAGGRSIQNAPAGHFTLQLSSASQSDSLKAYAKQHNLAHSWVYETKRDGKSWYVLVNGVYASSAEAKQAITTLPADVQAKKPWVKPIRQVKQDLNK